MHFEPQQIQGFSIHQERAAKGDHFLVRRIADAVAAVIPRDLVVVAQGAPALMSGFAAHLELRYLGLKNVLGVEREVPCTDRAFAHHVPQLSIFELAGIEPCVLLAVADLGHLEPQRVQQLEVFFDCRTVRPLHGLHAHVVRHAREVCRSLGLDARQKRICAGVLLRAQDRDAEQGIWNPAAHLKFIIVPCRFPDYTVLLFSACIDACLYCCAPLWPYLAGPRPAPGKTWLVSWALRTVCPARSPPAGAALQRTLSWSMTRLFTAENTPRV